MREGMDKSVNSTESNNSSSMTDRKRRRSRRSGENELGSDNASSHPVEEDQHSEAESKPLKKIPSDSTRKSSGGTKSSSRRSSSQQQQRPAEDDPSSDSSYAADERNQRNNNKSNINNAGDRRKNYMDNNNSGSADDSQHSSGHSGRSLLDKLSTMAESPQQGDSKPSNEIVRKIRLLCGKIVEDSRVQLGIIILIIVNAILMGIATFDFVTDDPSTDDAFEKTDRVFLVIFTAEMLLQLIYRSVTFFTDPWLIFDFVIVIASWSLESLQIVRAFRIFRAFRLVTRIGPLRELVMAIGAVMPRMYAIAMLLFLIFYIFAVLFTELFSELTLSDNYFGSLDVSLFTCMEMMTLEWAGTTRELMEQKSWAWAPLLAFISVTGFIVFNLIVAVVCDAVAVVDREVQAEKHPEMLSDKEKLNEAQERIWELTETVEILMMRQERLLSVVDMLSKEIRTAVMDPASATALPRNNPILRSAMKNANRNNIRDNVVDPSHDVGEVLHFSDDEEEDKKHNDKDNMDKRDVLADDLEKDVNSAVDRITRGSGGRASPISQRVDKNSHKFPNCVKTEELRPKGKVNSIRGAYENGSGPRTVSHTIR